MWLQELLGHEVSKLEGHGGMLNVRKGRYELLTALGTLNGEISRQYLDEI